MDEKIVSIVAACIEQKKGAVETVRAIRREPGWNLRDAIFARDQAIIVLCERGHIGAQELSHKNNLANADVSA